MAKPLVEKLNDNADSQEEEAASQIDESELSEEEAGRLRRQEVTTDELAEERNSLKASAEVELNRLVRDQKIIDLNEYRRIRQELEDTRSPDKTRELLKEIQELPRLKEKQKIEAGRKLDPDHPKLLELQKKAEDICSKNVHLIGTSQIESFKTFFAQERRNEPTIGHLTELIEKLEGKIPDQNGLAPRREEFGSLQRLFRKFGLNPLESSFIKKEGLSERTAFRKTAEELATHFEHQQDTGFYSQEMVRKTMSELLRKGTPEKIKEALLDAKNIARQESEAFTYMDSQINIGGRSIRKMSEASKHKFLEYYQQIDLKERKKTVANIRTLVENEAKLGKELEDIYKDDPDKLELAMESFQELDYLEKEKALKEHKNIVADSKDKTKMEKQLTIKAAHAKIDTAARKKVIAQGANATQGKYKAFFNNPENFKNPDTKKPDDLGELKRAYESLANSSAEEKHKNLAAYEERRNGFMEDLQELSENGADENTVKEWQDRYDKAGWSEREKIAQEELPAEIARLEEENHKNKEAGLGEHDKKENKETFGSRNELILALNEHLAEDTAESISEGLRQIRMYFINNPEAENDKVLLYLEEQLAHRKRELGESGKGTETHDAEIENEMKQVIGADSQLQFDLEEHQIQTLNIEGVKQSEDQHGKQKDARERAKKDSLERTESDSLEEQLTQDAYNQIGDEYVLNDEGTGQEITEIGFDDLDSNKEEVVELKALTRKEQSKLNTQEGFSHVTLTEKSGRTISSREADKIQREQLAEMEEEIADTTVENMHAKKGSEVSNLNDRIAASRKAHQMIEQKRHERITA